MDRSEQILQQLNRLSGLIAHALEFSEAKAEQFDAYLALMTRNGLLSGRVFVGDVIHRHPYAPGAGPQDSALVYMAAIVADRGLGCGVLDMEEYLAAKEADTLEEAAILHFVPFSDCPPFVRAVMLPQTAQFLERISQELRRFAR
jgi:hypothetical protein